MKIAVIGAGNGGQTMAGHFSYLGFETRLYSRNLDKLHYLIKNGGVLLKGALNGFGKVQLITDNLQEAIEDVDLIMITTVANAHGEIAEKIAPILKENQVVVLNPGRTFGALEFRNYANRHADKRIYVAETQSLLYACRSENNGEVRVIGVKNKVPTAALPSSDTKHVLSVLNRVSSSFIEANNILETSLDNIGCIFHPSIVLFNAAKIERGENFYFYNDMSPRIAEFLVSIDKERLAIGKALGIDLISVTDWISYSYKGVTGNSLLEKMQNNPAYYKILAPTRLDSRLLTEDIPTGVLPLMEMGKLLNIPVPLLESIYILSSQLLDFDFRKSGRTLQNLGLNNMNVAELLKIMQQ